jgi:acyl-CoA synthetase (AMP-forming)/AMP-acid ligase II
VIGEMRRRLHHALRVARGAYAPAFAKEGHKLVMCAISAAGAGKAVDEDAARQIFAQRLAHIKLGGTVVALPVELACTGQLKPKIVPLSHRNVCASARNISHTLQLTSADRELHVMPLFHIHGLIAGVLAPMAVGIAAGPEVAIMDVEGMLLAAGEIGEIVIRGENVTLGYENNDKANAEGFTNGWFRTGDQGTMTADGYVTLTGRLKEIINRGGEKISPREVDEVLMDHPAVAQVVTFGMPHDKLGEEVAAAVVLREGKTATEQEIRAFVATKLADFKVPKKILIMDEIPKGATGKVQRIGLAQKLGLV